MYGLLQGSQAYILLDQGAQIHFNTGQTLVKYRLVDEQCRIEIRVQFPVEDA